ncbi:MAG: Gfo/Idh/MocA family oxidoreductase [Planctomycetaceae bacterium]|jgi:predicted dehydrogenase|nr:Gfo/Idh/MocA family oxidoreductase [Planctomycetaceae bacterium]
MKTSSRRSFLKKSVIAVGAAAASPYLSCFTQTGSTDKPLRFGFIGTGGQGRHDGSQFAQFGHVAAVCDVDSECMEMAAKQFEQFKPDQYKDYRKVLDRKDIDVVSVVTVDHWHVKIALEALQAGKHVFCEKPFTLTVEEGQLAKRAAAKYANRVFMIGTQQRTQREQFALAALMVRKGVLGDIKRLTANISDNPVGGPFTKEAPPATLDWDFWQGQCKPVEYIKERVHGNFRWWYEYSGGKFTDWGAHHIDICLWALGEDAVGKGPTVFTPIRNEQAVPFKDGYPTVDDCYNVPKTFEISCKFPSGVEMIVTDSSPDGNGILIEGTKGKIHVSRGRIAGKPMEEKWYEGVITDKDFDTLTNGKPFPTDFDNNDINHKSNFLRCIREGGKPISDVVSHVQTMYSCHLCSIASRLNREIKWDPQTETILGDEQASTFLASKRRKEYDIPSV